MPGIGLVLGYLLLGSGCGGGGTNGPEGLIGTPVNTDLVADAGSGGSYVAGDVIQLDCSGSSDPQGDALTFNWRQLDGPTVHLSDNTSCNPTFSAPDATATLAFRLEVSDTLSTDTDTVEFAIRGTEPIPMIVFTDAGSEAGIGAYSMAIGPHAGIAVEDYNDDGLIDIFVPNGKGIADQLYLNQGDGRFKDVATSVGLALLQNHRTALWIDYDGDHDLDLVIGGDCREDPALPRVCDEPENLWLYRQTADGTFEDVSVAAGLDVAWGGTADWHRGGISAGDINGDGYLDLVVVSWKDRAYLFLNNTDGTFSDITVAANLTDELYAYQQLVLHDFNRDGWVDIYFAIDGLVPNRLYINQGNNSFVDVAQEAGVDYASTDMGIALGDINNDGAIDIYVTEITQFVGDEYHHNQLYLNTATSPIPVYSEISEALGVQNGYWGWGATFIDYDNDGWQDLATTNGKNLERWELDRSRLWRNTGMAGRAFDDVSLPAQFNDSFIASGLIATDYDRDGDLDLVQTTSGGGPLRLLRNDPLAGAAAAGNYVTIKPRMPGTNHWAIGAIVTIEVGPLTMARVISAGISTDSQEPAEANFGLGEAVTVDRLIIDWPGGFQTSYTALPANQVYLIDLN